MKQFGGWHFPAHEQHLPDWLKQNGVQMEGRLAYQHAKIKRAMFWTKSWRTAVDVGGHIGLWSYYLASRFNRVIAFEPVAEHRACFALNVLDHRHNVALHDCALGIPEDDNATISIYTRPGSSGDSWVNGRGEIPLKRLDDMLAADEPVDFIKLDCEGYELFALQGGEAMLKRCRPTVIVEQKPGKAQSFGLGETDAVKYLQGLGYTLREHLSGDYILT